MPFTRDQYIDRIVCQLSVTQYELSSQNKLGRLNSNKRAEDFFCGLLNLIYDWKLVNANQIINNAPGIDLIDREKRVVVQVSSTADHDKIQSSINKLEQYYPDLTDCHFYMMVISRKQENYRKDFTTSDKVVFHKEQDIWDTHSLLEIINSLDVDYLIRIYEYLKKETGITGELSDTNIRTSNVTVSDEKLKENPYLFISYCHKDREKVFAVLQQFYDAGLRYWCDDNLETGVNYAERIESAIDFCRGAIFFLTDNSVESEWCRNEMFDCLDLKPGHIYPIYVEKTELKYGLRVRMKQIQFFNLSGNNGDVHELIEVLKKQLPEVFIILRESGDNELSGVIIDSVSTESESDSTNNLTNVVKVSGNERIYKINPEKLDVIVSSYITALHQLENCSVEIEKNGEKAEPVSIKCIYEEKKINISIMANTEGLDVVIKVDLNVFRSINGNTITPTAAVILFPTILGMAVAGGMAIYKVAQELTDKFFDVFQSCVDFCDRQEKYWRNTKFEVLENHYVEDGERYCLDKVVHVPFIGGKELKYKEEIWMDRPFG